MLDLLSKALSLLFLFWKFYNSDTGRLLLSTGWRLLDVPQVIHISEKFLHQHCNISKFVLHDKFPLVKILLIILCSGVLLSTIISSSFTANLEIRKFEKWTVFYWKIRGLSGNFDWISGKSWKINTFLEKYFLMIKFLSVLLSVMYMFMFWNIFLLFLAMSILLQPVFLCLKIWVLKCNMLDCCRMHHNCMDFYLIEVTNLHGYQKQQFWEVNFCNVIL